MKIVVPKESYSGEKRVATTPEIVEKLVKRGYSVSIETGAGNGASFSDAAFRDAGAETVSDTAKLYEGADIVLKVRAPQMGDDGGVNEIDLIPSGALLISFIWPAQNEALLKALK